MFNATLTVQENKPNSHANCGWQQFTDAVISILERKKKGVIFFLWGLFAQKKGASLSAKHFKILSAHPSPMSGASWINCGCFEEARRICEANGIPQIDWRLSA